jgi:hypothetical protein
MDHISEEVELRCQAVFFFFFKIQKKKKQERELVCGDRLVFHSSHYLSKFLRLSHRQRVVGPGGGGGWIGLVYT